MKILRATKKDLTEILKLQKKAFLQVAEINDNFNIQPLIQTIEETEIEFEKGVFLKAETDSEIVGSIRANMEGEDCWVQKLMVHPGCQRKGIGKALLTEIENYFPEARYFKLGTGTKLKDNIRLFDSMGYRIVKYDKFHDGVDAVFMEKSNILYQ